MMTAIVIVGVIASFGITSAIVCYLAANAPEWDCCDCCNCDDETCRRDRAA